MLERYKDCLVLFEKIYSFKVKFYFYLKKINFQKKKYQTTHNTLSLSLYLLVSRHGVLHHWSVEMVSCNLVM